MDTTPWERSVLSDVQSSPQTFSSWDKCMAKAYCKWPLIIGCVMGGLILLSLVWCFIRCCCCGMSFCCGCFSCCGGRRSSRPPKHSDDPHPHRSAPPTATGGYMPTQPPAYAPPQFATFDASHKGGAEGKAVNEDALPAMPSWESARTRKVLEEVPPSQKDHIDDVELGDLNYNKKATGSRAPMLDHAAPPAGYDEIGVATPMQSPNGNAQGHGRVGGYGRDHDRISPYGEPQGFAGDYRRLGTPKSPHERAYGGPQRNPEGTYQQDPYTRSSHGGENYRDDYFGYDAQDQASLRQNEAGGYGGSTQSYGQRENFQPQLRQNDNVFAGNNNSCDRGNTRNPPVQRQNAGGYTGDTQRPFPKISSPPPGDLPDILAAGPKSQTPPPARQGTPGADGRSYRAYTPSPVSPTYSAYQSPQRQKQHPTWAVL